MKGPVVLYLNTAFLWDLSCLFSLNVEAAALSRDLLCCTLLVLVSCKLHLLSKQLDFKKEPSDPSLFGNSDEKSRAICYFKVKHPFARIGSSVLGPQTILKYD